jgi:hypothetical protein
VLVDLLDCFLQMVVDPFFVFGTDFVRVVMVSPITCGPPLLLEQGIDLCAVPLCLPREVGQVSVFSIDQWLSVLDFVDFIFQFDASPSNLPSFSNAGVDLFSCLYNRIG